MLLCSSYTELSCPSGVMRCNVKEFVQLVDWCQSWYAETSSSNKDHSIVMGIIYMYICIMHFVCMYVCMQC